MEEFYQKEELSTRIGNILEEYPAGIGPFKEFIQNADDARARRFVVIYDEGDERNSGKEKGEGLLSKEMEEWQGPSLYIYNDSVFSDNDFANVVSLGKSQKHDDNSRIGKYGLGFNVAYHFTDVVSFISRDQIVYFDPHGTSLPDGKQGLKIKYLEGDHLEKYFRQFSTFSSVKGLNCSLKESFNGTMIRLPLRNERQATKSTLCKSCYEPQEIKGILHDLANSSASILLFLRYVEEISIYFKNGTEEFKVSESRVSTSESLRMERSLINSIVGNTDKKKKKTESSFQMEIVTTVEDKLRSFASILHKEDSKDEEAFDGQYEEREKWRFHQGSGVENEESHSLAKRSGSVHWGSIAALSSFTSSSGRVLKERKGGNAYSFLPLPIETGLPIHLNAFFAVSSNRRTLWMGTSDSTGAGELKVAWNEFTLKSTLPKVYADFILSSRDSNGKEDQFSLWPNLSRVKTPFDFVAKGMIKSISDRKLKVFYSKSSGEWLDLSQIVVEDQQTRLHCGDKLRAALSEIGINLIDLPDHVKELMKASQVTYKVADAKFITDEIRRKMKLSYEVAEELLQYILVADAKELTQGTFELLNEIQCIPLVRNQLGVFNKSGMGNNLYVCPDSYLDLLPKFTGVLSSSSKSFDKLVECANKDKNNIKHIQLEIFVDNLKDILPLNWQGSSCVFFPSISEKEVEMTKSKPNSNPSYLGTRRDEALASFNNKTLSNAVDESKEEDSEWGEVTTRRKKGNQKTNTIQHVQVGGNKEEEIDEEQVRERIRLLWKFVEEHKLSHNKYAKLLSAWPLVITEEGYCLSLDYAKSRATLASSYFVEEMKGIFRKFGVLFARDATEENALSILLETKPQDLIKALSIFSNDSIVAINQEDLLEIRHQVIKLSGDASLDANSIRSLPIFTNLKGELVAVLSSGHAIATPSDDENLPWKPFTQWDQILSTLCPELVLDLREPESREIYKIAGLSRLHEEQFILSFFIPRIEIMNMEACVFAFKEMTRKKISKKKFEQIVDQFKRTNVIINSENVARPCNFFVDPEDSLLCEILADRAENQFPPVLYREPSVLRVMRLVGMKQVTNALGFHLAAERIAQSGNERLANRLCDVFVSVHKDHNFDGWKPRTVYDQISQIPFIPAVDLRRCKSIPSWVPLPNYITFQSESKVKGKKATKPQGHKGYKSMKMQIEDELYDDYYEYEESELMWEPWELFENACSMMNNPPKCDEESDTIRFSSPSQCVLRSAAFSCWTESLLLPACFESMSRRLLKYVVLEPIPSPSKIANHVSKLTAMWGSHHSSMTSSTTGLSKSEINFVQGAIVASLTPIWMNYDETRNTKTIAQFRYVPFILMDDGCFIESKQIVLDMDTDLSPTMRALPNYLSPFSELISVMNELNVVVSPSHRPIITEKSIDSKTLLNKLQDSLNDPTFADVIFNVEGKKIYAHKLILCFSSEVFERMFKSGMKESGIGIVEIHSQEWCTYEALWIFLHYLYTGMIKSQTYRMDPPSENSAQVVCTLLRLADEYLVEYLRQFCERYLTDPAIAQMRNFCNLLILSDETKSKGLERFYITEARKAAQVLRLTEEWNLLPTRLKEDILRIS
eukprot:TRINITY_DN6312_c0_g1_i1.p1 TRINITY_DN6312_c0_g1~~TRINITY_DN6312_c0_g1_i1.p1  ORF type:complete len:1595 (-),score=487.74 TRINITY_DN6312_c0_g1_i1:214-4998(-)